MKSSETKTPAVQAKTTTPFFGKESGGGFFRPPRSGGGFFNGSVVSEKSSGAAVVQTKLAVGQPGDVYEKEADAMADKVVQRMSEPVVQKKSEPVVQKKSERVVQKMSEPVVRRSGEVAQCLSQSVTPVSSVAPASTGTGLLQPCVNCDQEEKIDLQEEKGVEPKGKLRMKPIFESNGEPPEDDETIRRKCTSRDKEKDLQKKEDGGSSQTASPAVESSLRASKGGGSSLPGNTRQQMESSFGANFSNVKIHDNSAAAAMNKGLGAEAFTHGNDIYFNSGKYDTSSKSGQHLLAHELTHTVQQGASGAQQPVQKSEEKIQASPAAGERIPTTDKQKTFFGYRNEIVELQGNGTFQPSGGLGNYIASLWEVGEDAPVNVRFGDLASGLIWVSPTVGSSTTSVCVTVDLSLLGPTVTVCVNQAPPSTFYNSKLQALPFHHPGFKDSEKGTLVLLVGILGGAILGQLGWIEGKKANEIDPLMDAHSAVTSREVFLPLIYGDDYDGTNYSSVTAINVLGGGSLNFSMYGELDLNNQQRIQGSFDLINDTYLWLGDLHGKAMGLEDYEFPINRSTQTGLFGDSVDLELDKKWTSADPKNDKGAFVAEGQVRMSYKNRIFDLFAKASYVNDRFKGEVNIAIATESRAKQLFEEHAPIPKEKGGAGPGASATGAGDPSEPLALTAWGNLKFKLIQQNSADPKSKAGGPAGSKLPDLEGEGAFVVSSDGFIILAGKLRFPVDWDFSPNYDYRTDDPKDPNKHLVDEGATVAEFPVPEILSTVALRLGIKLDVGAHLDPIKLYAIDVSGVYSNHPSYRSEVGVTPRVYISGYADADVTLTVQAQARFLALFKVAMIETTLTGKARFNAYINAAPTIKIIWKGGEDHAKYGISGLIHAGGQLTFALSGGVSFEVVGKKTDLIKDYKIGAWTLNSFGLGVKMNEYIIGSGDPLSIDYSKIAFGKGQEANLGSSLAHKKNGKDDGKDKQTGGLEQTVDGKKKETGEFSNKPIALPDAGSDVVDSDDKENFAMAGTPHELLLHIRGTRNAPKASLEMASKPTDIHEKIEEEKAKLQVEEDFVDDDTERQLELQERDLKGIADEAQVVIKDAENTATLEKPGDDPPVVAGFDQLEEAIADYGDKYQENDLGLAASGPSNTPPLHDPLVDIPTGDTKDSPIDMQFYKAPEDYPPTIELQGKHGPEHFHFGSIGEFEIPNMDALIGARGGADLRRYVHGNKIEFGADRAFHPVEGVTVWRKVASARLSDVQRAFNALMNLHGHDMRARHEDADHVQDLQFEGPDDFNNIWALDSTINQSNWRFLEQVIVFRDKDGTVKTRQLFERSLRGKFFRVIGFQHF